MIEKIAGKPKIFIGSSTKSYELVKWLAEQIRSYDLAIPIEWQTGGFAPSKSTLENLIDNCKICDFAVLFFTRDDDKPPKGGLDDNPLHIFKGPRDNMIFEAGLFVGGLGLEPTRCILVSSVDEGFLPSDIKGVTYIKIKEPPPPEPPYCRIPEEWCREQLQVVLESVVYSVNAYGELLYRPYLKILSKKELAEREQVGKGCLEKYDRVVINSSEPEDMCEFDLAHAVAENIKHNVYYDFHFKISEENCENVSSQFIDLIRILLATYCIGENEYSEGDLKDEEDIKHFVNLKENRKTVEQAINDFRRRLSIYIHKYKHPIPFRIAVHNVSSFDRTICYLRHEDYYVEWFLKEEAREAIEILKSEDEEAEPQKQDRIFQATDTFDLYSNGISEEEWGKIKKEPHGAIKQFVNDNIDKFKLSQSGEERSRFTKEIKLRLQAIENKEREITFNKQVRTMLMKKIIELFPIELCEAMRDLCFGDKCEHILEEWEEFPKKGFDSDKCVTSVMTKFKNIQLTDTVKDALDKLNLVPEKDDDFPVRIYSDHKAWETTLKKLSEIKKGTSDREITLQELTYNDQMLDAIETFHVFLSNISNLLKSTDKSDVFANIKLVFEKEYKLQNVVPEIMEKLKFLQDNKGEIANVIETIKRSKLYEYKKIWIHYKNYDYPLIESEIIKALSKYFKDDFLDIPDKHNSEMDKEFIKLEDSINSADNKNLIDKVLSQKNVIEKWLQALKELLEHRTDILAAIQEFETEPNKKNQTTENNFYKMKLLLSYVLIPGNEADGIIDNQKIAYISKLKRISFANKLFKAMPTCKYIMVTEDGKRSGKWLGVLNKDDLLHAYCKS